MNGAESLIRTLLAGGVDTCFANPGTSEIHIVAALDRIPKCVACSACLKALSRERPTAMRAWRRNRHALYFISARVSAMVSRICTMRAGRRCRSSTWWGSIATDHLRYDTPLTSDIEGHRATLLEVAADISQSSLKSAATLRKRSSPRALLPARLRR
jgi:acetolactate synthase I/II/III large subunit